MTAKNKIKVIARKIKDLIALMRPNAWFVTVFSLSIGAVFALPNTTLTTETGLKFLFLCFAFAPFIAGGLYALNDVNDRKVDQRNPDKARRPIASGRITPIQGIIFSLILLTVGCFLALQISFMHLIFALMLIFLQLIYSMPPIRLKETSIDFLFSGPLNHMIRFTAAWILFKPITQIPLLLLASLFTLYCVAYIYYKLVDKEFTPKKSIARNKNIQTQLNYATAIGIGLMFASILLLKEVDFVFIACPTFLTLALLTQAAIPSMKKIGLMRSLFYGYAPFSLMLGVVSLWVLIIMF